MAGNVSFADWSVCYAIPSLKGGGMEITAASFKGKTVLFKASQPFVLVPYHGNCPTFKDGLSYSCGAAPFTSMTPLAPNAPEWDCPPGTVANNDNQFDAISNPTGAVAVEKVAATLTEPAKAVIWTKQQAVNYQYIQRWEFNADGSIDARVGLGGRLFTYQESREGHIHNFYFRLDFDIISSADNLVQEFAHLGNNAGDDKWWVDINTEDKRTVDPKKFTKWRILNKASIGKTPAGADRFRSYELIPASDGLPDGTYSTGDLWVVRYKPGAEDGSNVANAAPCNVGCSDAVISTQYVNGESVNGQDVVVWYCLRTHHQPRQFGEEKRVLPYEFIGFRMEPRDFLDDTLTGLYPTTPVSPL